MNLLLRSDFRLFPPLEMLLWNIYSLQSSINIVLAVRHHLSQFNGNNAEPRFLILHYHLVRTNDIIPKLSYVKSEEMYENYIWKLLRLKFIKLVKYINCRFRKLSKQHQENNNWCQGQKTLAFLLNTEDTE